jgi:tocopherol O-methyltransferase
MRTGPALQIEPTDSLGDGTADDVRQRIVRYYDGMQIFYSTLWSRHGVHYGFWDSDTRSRPQAIRNMDRVAARELDLPPRSRVLDAGCGVGGTSLFLAEECGHRVTGITLSPEQLRRAQHLSAQSPAAVRPTFLISDYLRTQFSAESFDGVVGIESVCYAEPKRDFLREAFRLLRPGGRLVVMDGFANKNEFRGREHVDYRRFVEGWALRSVAHVEAFETDLRAVGFENIRYTDRTASVMPSAYIMEAIAYVGFVTIGWLCKLEILPRLWLDHGLACMSQRRLFRHRTFVYGVFTASKGV